MKYFIGIDNGPTGSIGILDCDGTVMFYGPTPSKEVQNYTKKKDLLRRVRSKELTAILAPYTDTATVIIERPMVNPMRWKATVTAIRADEATLSVFEILGARHEYVDSKQWQKEMLPQLPAVKRPAKDATPADKKTIKAFNARRKGLTKTMSLEVGRRLFPKIELEKDADALLMAEWARRNNL